jgi:hypothetical protein
MDEVDEMLIEVRAGTQGFEADIARMRGAFDSTLVEGFRDAGSILERGLLSAVRRGSLGFDDLKRVALRALDEIAAQALQIGFGALSGPLSGGGGIGNLLGGLAGAIFGLPGRATGGPVSPGRGYLVGERGPELFVPTAAGRVEASLPRAPAREVRVSINIAPSRGTAAPEALQRSSRQVASAVRRSLFV